MVTLVGAEQAASRYLSVRQRGREKADEEMQKSVERAIQAYVRQLDMVTSFKYMRRLLTEVDDNWLAVVRDHRKAQKSWARLAMII